MNEKKTLDLAEEECYQSSSCQLLLLFQSKRSFSCLLNRSAQISTPCRVHTVECRAGVFGQNQ